MEHPITNAIDSNKTLITRARYASTMRAANTFHDRWLSGRDRTIDHIWTVRNPCTNTDFTSTYDDFATARP